MKNAINTATHAIATVTACHVAIGMGPEAGFQVYASITGFVRGIVKAI